MNFAFYQAQQILFPARPSRLALQQLELEADGLRGVSINVWRNHALEPVIALARPYLAYAHWDADFRLSDYDDALMFNGHRPADIELLWLDSSRYLDNQSFDDWLDWLSGRIRALRGAGSAPIIVAAWFNENSQRAQLQALADSMPGVYFADPGRVCNEAGVKLTDARTAAVAGTPVSNAAQPLLARELACRWLPAAIIPPIKVVALDLDNTLHAGVLGEDGITGVQLTPAHAALQDFIKSLRQRGIFIALVSRNERADVEALFTQREEYPLRWQDFSAIEISWDDKAVAIDRIARLLRVGTDAILFVDDNPGEMAGVTAQLPGIHTVYAGPDAAETQRVIEYYPGLWRWKAGIDDTKRIQDMKASAERESLLAGSNDAGAYFRSLQVELTLRGNPADQLDRLADLCGKTNQFNLALRRFNQAEIAAHLENPDACVASVQLKDKLSDSGVIAVIVAERDGDRLVIEELCISCRALGRQLEDAMILEAVRQMPLFAGCRKVAFHVRQGPRNQPALDWLKRLLRNDTQPGPGLHPVPAGVVQGFVPPDGVTLIRE